MTVSILLAHGGGGACMRELIDGVILPAIGRVAGPLSDAASVPGHEELVMTTDSFVVKPLVFRGGDIGSLSVHGTVNDLAVSGAEPLALTMGLIIEEGFSQDTLAELLASAGRAANECGVRIIAGDTKVVARGEADGLFINTAGLGLRRSSPDTRNIRPGDVVLLSGGIAEHGVAILSSREGLAFETPIVSDAGPVWPLVKALLDAGITPRCMRDPTRGGLAATCVEFAEDAQVSIILDERAIPVKPEVRAACSLLGLDPLTVANEGKLVAVVAPEDAVRAVEILRATPQGRDAVRAGHVVDRQALPVSLRTTTGGLRLVELPYGEELPRIC